MERLADIHTFVSGARAHLSITENIPEELYHFVFFL